EVAKAREVYAAARKQVPGWASKPLRRIRRRVRAKLLQCFCAGFVNPAFIERPPQYVARFLSPAESRNFAKDPECDMTEDFVAEALADRKSTRLNSSHQIISYAVFCLK